MGKKLVKPAPVAPQRVKKATPLRKEVKVYPPKSIAATKAAESVAEPEQLVGATVGKAEDLATKRAMAEAAYPTPTESVTNDRGPTQLTISRMIRNRFRKACFVSGATMSDTIEGMMDRYATDAGF